MNTIGAFDSKPVLLLDTDVATSATVRSNVFHNAPGTPSCSVELVVTPLGATPVNLTVKWLGQDSAPASETATLYPLNVVVPDTSAIAAAYTVVFVLPIYTLYSQLQVTVASGGNVHVTAYVQGCSTEFTDTPQTASGAASHVVVDSGAVTANLGTVAGLALDATMTGGTQQSKITDGTRVATVKAASTAAAAADLALVVAISPNNTVTVIPGPIATRVAGTDTNVAAGTRRTFPSTVHTQGFYFSNIHATAVAYIGDPSTVSSTVYDLRLLPGQRSEWLPFVNPNAWGWDTDTSGMILKTVGG